MNDFVDAICAVVADGTLCGTAWLPAKSKKCVVTAGHLFATQTASIVLRFRSGLLVPVRVKEKLFVHERGIDFAILEAIDEVIWPSQGIHVAYDDDSSVDLMSGGFGETLVSLSTVVARRAGQLSLESEADVLYRTESEGLGDRGFSGAPVIRVSDGKVISIQIEAVRSGVYQNSQLSMPIWRIAKLCDCWSLIFYEKGVEGRRLVNGVALSGVPDQPPRFLPRVQVNEIQRSLKSGAKTTWVVGPHGSGKSSTVSSCISEIILEKPFVKEVIWLSIESNSGTYGDLMDQLCRGIGYPPIQGDLETKENGARRFFQGRSALVVIDNVELLTKDIILRFYGFCDNFQVGVIFIFISADYSSPKIINPIVLRNLSKQETLEYLILCVEPTLMVTTESFRFEEHLSEIFNVTNGSPKGINLLASAMLVDPPKVVLRNALSDLEISDIRLRLAVLHISAWERLSPEARSVLKVFAIIHGSASRATIAASAGIEESRVRQELIISLKFLVDTSILGEEYRYRIHSSTQDFLRQGNIVSNEEKAKFAQNLSDFLIPQLDEVGDDADRFLIDMQTINGVFPILEEICDDERYVSLAKAVYDIHFSLGLFRDRIEYSTAAGLKCENVKNYAAAAFFATVCGSTQTIIGEYQEADKTLKHGGILARLANSDFHEAYIKRCIALNYYRQGMISEARGALVGLRHQMENVGNLGISSQGAREVAHAIIDVIALEAAIYLFENNLDRAQALNEDMLSLCKAARWERAESYPYRDLAEVHMARRLPISEAEPLLVAAFDIARRFKDERQLARVHLTLSKVTLKKGDIAKAEEHYRAGVEICVKLGLKNECNEFGEYWKKSGLNNKYISRWRRFLPYRIYYGRLPIAGE